jgi:pre-mRNA-splicing factor ISY1
MRQKHYWEIKIRELGGGDYNNLRTDLADVGLLLIYLICIDMILDGRELPGASDYKYYGAAKNLPGVREIFAELEATAEKKRIQRFFSVIYKCLKNYRAKGERKYHFTAEYYGYDDDNSEELLRKERDREVFISFSFTDIFSL